MSDRRPYSEAAQPVAIAVLVALILALGGLALHHVSSPGSDFGKAPESLASPLTWAPITDFTLFLVVVGVGQGVVFWKQARTLERTIDTMRDIDQGQGNRLQASIDQATRSAGAMELVATHIGISAQTTLQIAEFQKRFWMIQMRAYITVELGFVFPQDSAVNRHFEPIMLAINVGATPAFHVKHSTVSAVLPVELPADFDFVLQAIDVSAPEGLLGPRQNFMISAVVPELIADHQVTNTMKGIDRALYVWGRVEYADVDGVPHHTNFARKIVWFGDKPIAWNTIGHNDAE